MSAEAAIGLRDMYSCLSHTDTVGIQGYHIEHKYLDAAKIAKDRQLQKVKKGQKDRKYQTKRGNYLDDESKVHKNVPGPGHYPKTNEWPEKTTLKIHYPNKETYIDQILKRGKKEKKPAPGQYNVVKTLKQLEAEKKKLASRKVQVKDKINYLDQIQYEANLLPGVGNYNPRIRVKTQFSQLKSKPQDWKKKHELSEKKKPQKSPDMRTYSPLPVDFSLFENLKNSKSTKSNLSKVQRFKTFSSGSGMDPSKYTVLQEWRGKQTKKINKHGLQVLSSKAINRSIYYH